MPSFPVLKSGVVAQYPSERGRRFSTRVYRFVDGSEQRFPLYSSALKRWVVRLEFLNEAEVEAVESFFVSEAGRAGHFEFTDPFDGTVHADCSFEDDVLTAEYRGLGDGGLSVVVRENR